jgi:hypothetical protein
MREFYNVTDKLKETLRSYEGISTVTFGDITQVDLKRQSIFPLAHIVVNSADLLGNVINFNFSILFLDLVDESDQDLNKQEEPFYGINNLQDVYNSLLAQANHLDQDLRRGDLFAERYTVTTGSLEATQDHLENVLAGWVMNINIEVPNNKISVC